MVRRWISVAASPTRALTLSLCRYSCPTAVAFDPADGRPATRRCLRSTHRRCRGPGVRRLLPVLDQAFQPLSHCLTDMARPSPQQLARLHSELARVRREMESLARRHAAHRRSALQWRREQAGLIERAHRLAWAVAAGRRQMTEAEQTLMRRLSLNRSSTSTASPATFAQAPLDSRCTAQAVMRLLRRRLSGECGSSDTHRVRSGESSPAPRELR